jgi:hypothetical protein
MATTDRRRGTNRALPFAAALGAFTLIAGCSSDSDSAASTLPPIASAASTSVASTAPTTVAPTAPPIDGVAVLQEALAALSTSYHFTTVATVDGAEAVRADGDRLGDTSRLLLVSNGASANYIVTPEGAWALPEDGEWEALETPPATTDPIAALAAPAAVVVDSSAGDTVNLTVTVPGIALGIPESPDTPVQVVVVAGVVQQVSYTTTVNGAEATVVATLGPPLDTTPITPPI